MFINNQHYFMIRAHTAFIRLPVERIINYYTDS